MKNKKLLYCALGGAIIGVLIFLSVYSIQKKTPSSYSDTESQTVSSESTDSQITSVNSVGEGSSSYVYVTGNYKDAPTAPALTWLDNLDIPEYSGKPYAVINDNKPLFDTDNLTTESYEIYYALDSLGRCTLAEAVIGQDIMATGGRGSISSVKPTGWHSDRYSFVNGEALYNRCHLIAHYLSDENANPLNLVTGTRYMNEDGMNDFENLVGDYVKETGNHVRYRVTPVWTDDNLICDGLLVEAYSIEDDGDDICFCIYAYNVQPGVFIDYKTGDNYALDENEGKLNSDSGNDSQSKTNNTQKQITDPDIEGDFVLNKKNKKFHLPGCDGAVSMSEKNRQEYSGSRNALITDGYEPCGQCNP